MKKQRPKRTNKSFWNTSKEGTKLFSKGHDNKSGRKKPHRDEIRANQKMKEIEKLIDPDNDSTARVGSGRLAHRIGTEKLESIGFDPMDKIVQQLEEIEQLIEDEKNSDAPRATYIDKLMNLKFRILDTILPYKYGKAPIVTINETDPETPINIILNLED